MYKVVLKKMDHCARRAATEQLKFLWNQQVKKIVDLQKSYFLW